MAPRSPQRLFDDLLSRAIPDVRAAGVDVFTFAVYHDHESAAISVCVDTASSSARLLHARNASCAKRFAAAIDNGDLETAERIQVNDAHSLSLGDFALVNVARTRIGSVRANADFYLEMIRAIRRREADISSMTTAVDRLLFCCSSATWEVGLTWAAAIAAV